MGVRPWEMGLMTVGQFDQACADIDAYVKASKPKEGTS